MYKKQSGLGIAGMVIGIFALLLSCVLIGGVLGIVGLILSIIALTQGYEKNGMAITGLILNALAIIITIIMFIVALSNPSTTSQEDVSQTRTPAPVTTPAPEDLPEEFLATEGNEESSAIETQTAPTTSETAYNVGETAIYKDIEFTLIGYQESSGNDWGSPAAGKVFIYPEFEISNNSSEEISISSMASFECYCDDYSLEFSSSAFMAMSTEDSMGQLDGSIAPGKKMKGCLGLEVPEDWQTIEIYYKNNMFMDSNFSFIISK